MILNSSLPSTGVPSAKIRNSRNLGTYYFSGVGAPDPDWTTPQNSDLWQSSVKTLFDPCPAGWRVPKSGEETESPWNAFGMNAYAAPFYYYINGVKQTAAGIPVFVEHPNNGRRYDRGGGSLTAWYPATGYRDFGYGEGAMWDIGGSGFSYSSSVSGTYAMYLGFHSTYINPSYAGSRAYGLSVRCLRE